ncbi:50S ribosomal protein L35 [Candidatus Kaiserbacteria bacterium]|nr:50S ribosomal protein L35 [Candidatus Kaiserbacteria bacterium]
MKTNKSYSKRIRVTRNGKLMARKPGQNHFNAKQSGTQRRAKRGSIAIKLTMKVRRRFLPATGAK